MAKYRITIENLEGGDYEGTDTVELENLVISGSRQIGTRILP